GEPYGDEEDGRSQAISRDVLETVEWLMPDLLRVFMGSDDVVHYEPVGPEDEQAAIQATDYANHIFWKDNPGYQLMYDWFKDALLQKVGVLKVWWAEEEKVKRDTYTGLSFVTVTELEND